MNDKFVLKAIFYAVIISLVGFLVSFFVAGMAQNEQEIRFIGFFVGMLVVYLIGIISVFGILILKKLNK